MIYEELPTVDGITTATAVLELEFFEQATLDEEDASDPARQLVLDGAGLSSVSIERAEVAVPRLMFEASSSGHPENGLISFPPKQVKIALNVSPRSRLFSNMFQ